MVAPCRNGCHFIQLVGGTDSVQLSLSENGLLISVWFMSPPGACADQTMTAAANCQDAGIVCALTRAGSIGRITRMREEEGDADHSGKVSATYMHFQELS